MKKIIFALVIPFVIHGEPRITIPMKKECLFFLKDLVIIKKYGISGLNKYAKSCNFNLKKANGVQELWMKVDYYEVSK